MRMIVAQSNINVQTVFVHTSTFEILCVYLLC